ncbi:hypothetical protein B0H11DRAFT_2070384 [Mycena galericulata]|nr:hypothetical protein B0H11DRAFT_2070384 [Mycena galericulata]
MPIPSEDSHISDIWDGEDCRGTRLIPVSSTCRYLREHAKPWIFRKMYNWSRDGDDVWPDTLWPVIVEAHLRNNSIRHPKPIALSTAIFRALPSMSSLKKVTLRLDIPISSEILMALSLVPHLTSLDISQARLDGPSLSFPQHCFISLATLSITIWKFTAVVSPREVDPQSEWDNVVTLLRTVSGSLTSFSISGDLLSPDFLSLKWPLLKRFTVTEHTPVPYLLVPEIISQMPVLFELSILYSSDLTRSPEELRPPFTLGTLDSRPLTAGCAHLRSVTLSNLQPADPIFAQLPVTLEAVHIVAARDLYIPEDSAPRWTQEFPLTPLTALTVLEHMSHLTELAELTLTLDHFPTPALISVIAAGFPSLRFLELGCLNYLRDPLFFGDVRDEALLEPLAQLTSLTHLRISLDFYARDFASLQEGRQRSVARWFFMQLPTLQLIGFSFQEWIVWHPGDPLERASWSSYDRSILRENWSSPPVYVIPDVIIAEEVSASSE